MKFFADPAQHLTPTPGKLGFFTVYSNLPKSRSHLCIARARSKSDAVKTARSQGFQLGRGAYARALSVQEYAAILRGAGLKVSGIPEQLQLMECGD